MKTIPPWMIEDVRPRHDERVDGRRQVRLEIPLPRPLEDPREQPPPPEVVIVIEP